MRRLSTYTALLGCCLLLVLSGCASTPNAKDFFAPVSPEQRQARIRVFDTADEIGVLKACSSVLLDNGFQIFQAESRLGWLSSGKVKHTASFQTTALVYPARGKPGATALYLSLQGIDDPEVYQELFARISNALFLKVQQL